MKGCARSCLLWLIGWAAAASAVFVYLRRFGFDREPLLWAAVGAGFCLTLAGSYVIGIFGFSKERTMLLNSMVGRPPDDGQWVAVSGTIRSLNPLHAPMTGAPVVAYTYEIYRMESSGKSSSRVVYYDGKGLAPSTITSKQGAIRLLSVPTLDVPAEATDTQPAMDKAAEYVRTTTFETRQMPKSERTSVEDEWTDDDGSFRVDKSSGREVDIADCFLVEHNIKQGEAVCAFGLYSSSRGGLIPHANWAKQTRIMRGDATDVANQLRKRIIKYAIGVVFFAAAAYGITLLYERHMRTRVSMESTMNRRAVSPSVQSVVS
ncbi:MAG TPA: hypothetical protein VGQ76_02085 [Thermoanaerobaculia bacterium]|jgi:hypothetical protein|nr:hypothetical protein [Thermoanaerobaculia bacterium]